MKLSLDAAQQMGLDRTEFTEALQSSRVLGAIESDIAEGNRLDVAFPPRVYVQGGMVDVTTIQLEAVLENVLAEAGRRR